MNSVVFCLSFWFLEPLRETSSGLCHKWVWQSWFHIAPCRAGKGIWGGCSGLNLNSPGERSFKLWPACFSQGMHTDPDFSQYNSTKCLLGASSLFYRFCEDLLFLGPDQIWGRDFVENHIWQRAIPVDTRIKFNFGWLGSWHKYTYWGVCISSLLLAPFLIANVLSVFVSSTTPQK